MTVKELREAVILAAMERHFNVSCSYTEEVPEISGKWMAFGWTPDERTDDVGVKFWGRICHMGEFSPDEFRAMADELRRGADLLDVLNGMNLSYTLASVRLAYSD